MNRTRIVLFVSALLCPLSAQWLEDSIPVGNWPAFICWQPVGNKVYVSCRGTLEQPDSMVYVIDGATNEVLDSIAVGGLPCAVEVDSVEGRVFVACNLGNTVAIIDCAGDSLLAEVPTGHEVANLIYNPLMNKLYCGIGGNLSVIDCAGESLLTTLYDIRAFHLDWNRLSNKLYCGSGTASMVTVVDCEADTVVAVVETGLMIADICCNPRENEVYVTGTGGWSKLGFIDGFADTLIDTIPIGYTTSKMVLNYIENELFIVNEFDRLVMVDCATRRVVWCRLIPETEELMPIFNPTSNKLFSPNAWVDEVVYVVDGATHFVPDPVVAGADGPGGCCNRENNRVYFTNYSLDYVTVLADTVVVGVNESVQPAAPVVREPAWPSFVRRSLALPGHKPAVLLDISGREVMDLQPGDNDVRHLSPGVYFVRPAGDSPFRAKVILTR